MAQISLLGVSLTLVALALLVWWPRPSDAARRWFAFATLLTSVWSLGVAGLQTPEYLNLSMRITFAASALISPSFLMLVIHFPVKSSRPRPWLQIAALLLGAINAVLSLTTDLIGTSPSLTSTGFVRESGVLYPFFVSIFLSTWMAGLVLLVSKWRRARGLGRAQIQYLGAGIGLAGAGGITTNLLLPFFFGNSGYAWVGPYFTIVLLAFAGHAIIRHRLMDLRLIIHRSLTISLSLLVAGLPTAMILIIWWPGLTSGQTTDDLFTFVITLIGAGVLGPLLRDAAIRFLDTYLYRARTDYQRTVRTASRALTRVLHLSELLKFIADTVGRAVGTERIAIFLNLDTGFTKVMEQRRHHASVIQCPDQLPSIITNALSPEIDCLVADEFTASSAPNDKALHQELVSLRWALVLPLFSEESVIGAIAVGPKLSGDPYYADDLDLLTTLANQAGIAVRNAQLYTAVVLANEYIENIVATIESGVVAVTPAGQVTMFNRAAERLTGLAADQVRQGPLAGLPAPLAELLQATVASAAGRTEPEVLLAAGGVTRPVMCTTSPLCDPTGAVLGAVAVFSDLTPLKELELERRRAERLAYFEVLAASLAHEIKNPLVAVKAYAQLLPRRRDDDAFIESFSRIVTRQTDRMQRLVERLQALARPGDRPTQRLDLREPVQEAVDFLRPSFEEKRIALAVELGPEPLPVLGDHADLESLFINLLTNACEATPPDGRVTVAVAADGERIGVVVADSGPGIPPEARDRVFDPFFSTKRRGSGLGLTICAAIATAHRAKLRADNHPTGGAVFTVELPVAVRTEVEVRMTTGD